MTAVAKDHNVYTSIQAGDGVYKFTPATQEWTYYQLPTHGRSPRQMGFDDLRNEAWVPRDQADTVDRIQFRSVQQIQALKAVCYFRYTVRPMQTSDLSQDLPSI